MSQNLPDSVVRSWAPIQNSPTRTNSPARSATPNRSSRATTPTRGTPRAGTPPRRGTPTRGTPTRPSSGLDSSLAPSHAPSRSLNGSRQGTPSELGSIPSRTPVLPSEPPDPRGRRSRTPTRPHSAASTVKRTGTPTRNLSRNSNRSLTSATSPIPSARATARPNALLSLTPVHRLSPIPDPKTQCLEKVEDMDVRCTACVGDKIWCGERDGSISIREPGTSIPWPKIEKRRSAFVWCIAFVEFEGRDEDGKAEGGKGASSSHGHRTEGLVWCGYSDGFIQTFWASSHQQHNQFAKHAGGGGGIRALHYHVHSGTIFSGGNDFEVLAWDARTCECIRQISVNSGVRTLICDVSALYVGADDGVVSVWDVPTGQKTQAWHGHTASVLCLCRADRHVWSGSEDGNIRIWDVERGECVGIRPVHFPVTHMAAVGESVWSAAGDSIKVWDAYKLSLCSTHKAHDGYINGMQIMSRETHFKLWTTSNDRTGKVWTATSVDEAEYLRRRLVRKETIDYTNEILQRHLTASQERAEELSKHLQTATQEAERLRPLEPELLRIRSDLDATKHKLTQTERQLAEAKADRNAKEDSGRLLDAKVAELLRQNAELKEELVGGRCENSALQSKIRGIEDASAEQRRGTEVSILEVETQKAKLGSTIADLEKNNQRLNGVIDQNRLDIENLEQRLADAEQQRQVEVRELRREVAGLKSENIDLNNQLDDANNRNMTLEDQLASTILEVQEVQKKLTKTDLVFKSRLSLLTEVYKVYKRIERSERRARTGAPPSPNKSADTSQEMDEPLPYTPTHFAPAPLHVQRDLHAAQEEFRTVIAEHFTDDELNHLGASKHFFERAQEGSSRPHLRHSSPARSKVSTPGRSRVPSPSARPWKTPPQTHTHAYSARGSSSAPPMAPEPAAGGKSSPQPPPPA